MIKRKHFIIMIGLSIVLFCTGTIYAMTQTEVTNYFETGIVDIELSEYQLNGDTEEPYTDKEVVVPNQKISKIPRIQNDGVDCYIRAKITFRETDEVNDECLFGMDEKWVKADDGFYYYTEIVPHGSSVDLFDGLIIPEDFSKKYEEAFYIDIDTDAIQSKNFTPNFDSANPWGSVEILECEKEGMYDVSTFKASDSKSFEIKYLGDSGQLIKNEEDFFVNFPYLMPGDVYSDSVELVNDSEDMIKLYFRSEALDDSALLDNILLTITTEIGGKEEVVYSGSLRAAELCENIILGRIPKGDTGYFHFTIEVPAELNNEYTILDSYVTWIFSTELIEDSDIIPETGDTTNFWGFYLSLAGVLLCFFGVLGLKCTAKEEEVEYHA